ncbi:MAG: 50S ribosome-binding GTPase [Sedimentisphaerales bacterium]|nr:50S ribosome-binding GTPase [Sedimentisphaerales bacterium]
MSAYAAVITGQGSGAIATIQLSGASAQAILEKVFRPTRTKPAEFEVGGIALGHIVDGDEIIDQVTVGGEAPSVFTIHCHGNPLIVEAIVKLLERHGVELMPAEQVLAGVFATSQSGNAIAVEARLALTTVKTLAGARLIAHQAKAGLSEKLRHWRQQLQSKSLDGLAGEVRHVLRNSDIARLLIEGCTVALIGPAGAGKSTLLNALAGREKAIVTGIKGTTRDWVSAEIHLPPLAVTLIDTAGFGLVQDGIDQSAQYRSLEVLAQADVALLVLDATGPADQIDGDLSARLAAKRVIPVLNKSDLPVTLGVGGLPAYDHPPVCISAKQGTGINALTAAIACTCGVADFDPRTPVAFSSRQRRLLERLGAAGSPGDAIACIDDLLRGPMAPETAHEPM